MKQKIIIKKVQANPGSNSDIQEFGGKEQIDIPDGWNVSQLCATPLIKDGKTVQIAYTMLLEQIDCQDVSNSEILDDADNHTNKDSEDVEDVEEDNEASSKGFFDHWDD